jgi:predicted DNA-binding protein
MHGIVHKRKQRASGPGAARSPGRARKPSKVAAGYVRLPPLLDAALARISKKTGKPRSFYVRKGLEQIIEDTHDHLLAVASLRASRGKTYSLDEVKKRLGLEP